MAINAEDLRHTAAMYNSPAIIKAVTEDPALLSALVNYLVSEGVTVRRWENAVRAAAPTGDSLIVLNHSLFMLRNNSVAI